MHFVQTGLTGVQYNGLRVKYPPYTMAYKSLNYTIAIPSCVLTGHYQKCKI